MTRARLARIAPLLVKVLLLAGLVGLATWAAGVTA
jgi:hypothetical protein